MNQLLDQRDPMSSEQSLEFLLQPGSSGQLELFGDSKLRSKHATRSQFDAMNIESGLEHLQQKLSKLSDQPPSRIASTLEEVENTLHAAKGDLASVTIKGALGAAKVQTALGVLNHSLTAWRQHYPDTSPIRIDNRKCFASIYTSLLSHTIKDKR